MEYKQIIDIIDSESNGFSVSYDKRVVSISYNDIVVMRLSIWKCWIDVNYFNFLTRLNLNIKGKPLLRLRLFKYLKRRCVEHYTHEAARTATLIIQKLGCTESEMLFLFKWMKKNKWI